MNSGISQLPVLAASIFPAPQQDAALFCHLTTQVYAALLLVFPQIKPSDLLQHCLLSSFLRSPCSVVP